MRNLIHVLDLLGSLWSAMEILEGSWANNQGWRFARSFLR